MYVPRAHRDAGALKLTAGDREPSGRAGGPLDSHANKSRPRDKDPGNAPLAVANAWRARVRVNFRLRRGERERKTLLNRPFRPPLPGTGGSFTGETEFL